MTDHGRHTVPTCTHLNDCGTQQRPEIDANQPSAASGRRVDGVGEPNSRERTPQGSEGVHSDPHVREADTGRRQQCLYELGVGLRGCGQGALPPLRGGVGSRALAVGGGCTRAPRRGCRRDAAEHLWHVEQDCHALADS